MNKKLKTLVVSFMLITPMLSIPKLPTIPNITNSVKLPVNVEVAVEEAVKNLNINWGELFKNIEGLGYAR